MHIASDNANTIDWTLGHATRIDDPNVRTIIGRLQQELGSHPGLFRQERFTDGSRLITQGETDTDVYVLLEGAARVILEEDGASREVAVLFAPTIVGEVSALAQGRTASVIAQGAVETIALDAGVFRDLCHIYPDFSRSFSRVVLERLAQLDRNRSRGPGTSIALMEALALDVPDVQEGLIRALVDVVRHQPEILLRETLSAVGGAPIIRQGEYLPYVYLIVRGEAEVVRPDGSTVRVGPGSPLGEIAALSPTGIATSTVHVRQETEVFRISREHFRALREPAEALATERVNQLFARPLAPDVKETLRSIRDQNIEALILRTALDIVHSGTGIFRDLNPDEALISSDATAQASWSIIRQKCSVMQSVTALLKLGRTRKQIRAIVDEIRQYGLRNMPALKMFKGETALSKDDWAEAVSAIYKPHLPEALSLEEFTTVRERFELLQWLDALLLWDGAINQSIFPGGGQLEKLCTFLRGREGVTPEQIFQDIDDAFEQLMEAGLASGNRRIADDLKSVKFQRVQARIVEESTAGWRELPNDHPNHRALQETRERLGRGERSAIGGTDYAVQRFPRSLLNRVVEGKVQVVAFDGSRSAGIGYVLERFAPAHCVSGVQPNYMTTEVQGLDGAGGRTLITFQDADEQVLLLSGLGASRQRHNAASILLYERSGKRVPIERLHLASEGISYVDRMRLDLQRALQDEAKQKKVLGEAVAPDTLPTLLLILQNPGEFETALGGEMRFAAGAMFGFHIGYARGPEDRISRYILPKVGGRGLYGDTAGSFVLAFFSAGIPHVSNHVLFNGTAGAIGDVRQAPTAHRGRGLGELRPGETIILPLRCIAQYEGRGRVDRLPLRTLLGTPDGALPRDPVTCELFEQIVPWVCPTADHIAVGAPGVETYELIREFVALGFTSIDVEGGPILRAIERINSGRRGDHQITFTPFYTYSDNPLHSERDRYDSLAIMGPFFEGSRFNAELWEVLRRVLAFIQDQQSQQA